jgi:hypothetical protein
MQSKDVLQFPAHESQNTNPRSYSKRWKHESLIANGYTVIPSTFLKLYSRLKPYAITMPEAMLIVHLMEFKWDSKNPYPSYKTLALRMGVSDKRVRRLAQSLEQKGYLKRKMRMARTNEFDLNPLFDALAAAATVDLSSVQDKQAAK